MDRVAEHSETVRGVLERVAGWVRRVPKPGVETVLAEGTDHDFFLLKRLGWHAGARVDNTVALVRVKAGKVWVEEDWTDLTIADELVRAGVPKADIVLAFQPPELRHLTDFAVA